MVGIRKLGVGAVALLVSVVAVALGATPALATGDASTAPGETCPNEGLVGFSEALPECRGYEMVTPPFEEGEAPGVMAISTDGSHVINRSLGTYSGGESQSGLGAPYLVGLGVSGWDSTPLSVSSATFPAQEYWMATPDLSRSLLRLRSSSEPITGEDLYLREAEGSLVKIGSLVPPADEQGPAAGDDAHFYGATSVEYRDASDDLSHILFGINKGGPLWPFDSTIRKPSDKTSLYEYSGTDAKEPVLVGVGDGLTALNGFRSNPTKPSEPEHVSEILSPGALISDCQTQLGAGNGDSYNAMSSNGGTVYFTAAGLENQLEGPEDECYQELKYYAELEEQGYARTRPHAPAVNELYARVDESQTVPISEPTPEECRECQTGTESPGHKTVTERASEFAGTSDDGSKAFFLTEQELLPGDTGMNIYEYDFDAPKGEHVIPVSGATGIGDAKVLGVSRVSEDGSHVYFVADGPEVLTKNKNAYGRSAEPGEPNLYMFIQNAAYPTGEIIFITRLAAGDTNDWAKNDFGREIQVTPSGSYCVFVSRANVAAGGAVVEGSPQIFEYDAGNGEIVAVSNEQRKDFPQGAENANLGALESPIPTQSYLSGSNVGPTSEGTDLAVSADGSTVAFLNRGALTAVALQEAGVPVLPTERETNAYVFHSPDGVLRQGEVYLVAARVRSLEGLDASGNDVFFRTRQQLVPSDVDGAPDLYDARIDGGVPASAPEAACEGEACHGALGGTPVVGGQGTATVPDSGDLVSPLSSATPAKAPPSKPKQKAKPKRCKRGTMLEHGRCVKPKTSRSSHHRGSKR
jgi:hypothetical protein